MQAPEFVLFVNDPRLMNETYRRYLEARIRKAAPYPGLPIILTLRPRAKGAGQPSRVRRKGRRFSNTTGRSTISAPPDTGDLQ